MVEDLEATYAQFLEAGLAPTPIERFSREHNGFKLREPAGHTVKFYSNHVVGPV